MPELSPLGTSARTVGPRQEPREGFHSVPFTFPMNSMNAIAHHPVSTATIQIHADVRT